MFNRGLDPLKEEKQVRSRDCRESREDWHQSVVGTTSGVLWVRSSRVGHWDDGWRGFVRRRGRDPQQCLRLRVRVWIRKRLWLNCDITHTLSSLKSTWHFFCRLICLIWINKTRVKEKTYEYRYDERLKTKNEESTRLSDTSLVVELEHLKTMTRLKDEKFPSVMGECETETWLTIRQCCLLLIDKVRTKSKTYIWLSVRWKTKT